MCAKDHGKSVDSVLLTRGIEGVAQGMTELSERVRKCTTGNGTDLDLEEMRSCLGSNDKECIPGKGNGMCKETPRGRSIRNITKYGYSLGAY